MTLHSGKGFAAEVRHLPRLAAALTKAHELRLITTNNDDGGAQ